MFFARQPLGAALVCVAALAAPSAASAELPHARTLATGWEVRAEPAAPGDPQQPPPEETAPEGSPPSAPPTPQGQGLSTPGAWHSTAVPSVFDVRAVPELFPGRVRRYRLRFTGPKEPGFRWLISFESARRSAKVYLNGVRLGKNSDPYTPFAFEARGLRPGEINELLVIVDNRKDPRLREGWWNWGGIVRRVRLVPVGRAYLSGLGMMSDVRCRGRARRCKAKLIVDGILERRGSRRVKPTLTVRLRAPGGRIVRKTFKLRRLKGRRRAVRVSLRVPAPALWAPERPQLYSARLTLRDKGQLLQVAKRAVGLRSVRVKNGGIYLNNRRLRLRGASIHEDMPGAGAALSSGDMSRIVADLKEVGANVTRSHYLLSDRLLSKLDRAGIMVWNQAPIWQRDRGANLLQYRSWRKRSLLTVRRTVRAARSHPSVITHSLANELSGSPDHRRGTRLFLTAATRFARQIDPTLPLAIDINGRPGHGRQRLYRNFDILGINQYFGWYRWVEDFNQLEPFLRGMHSRYPKHALVISEFGAEGRPENRNAAPGFKGGYAFQAMHTARTLDLVDRLPYLSGAIYWTMREFEIYPGWTGGAGVRAGTVRNTRHHKGLLGYMGEKKPAWYVAQEHFLRTPLYRGPP